MEKENSGGRYTFRKWNGKYGSDAKFVVQDNDSGKQSMFTPGRTQDLVWSRTDLTSDSGVKEWEDFGEESTDDLESIAF